MLDRPGRKNPVEEVIRVVQKPTVHVLHDEPLLLEGKRRKRLRIPKHAGGGKGTPTVLLDVHVGGKHEFGKLREVEER